MKKLVVLFACFIGVLFFASCDEGTMEDILAQKPNIVFLNEEGYCHADCNEYVNTELHFLIQATPNANSKSPLYQYNFSITDLNGHDLVNETDYVRSDTLLVTKSFITEKAGTYIITASVTDTAEKVNTAVLNITLIDPFAGQIGKYEGYVNISGEVVFDTIFPQQQLQQDSIKTSIILSEGNAPDEINAIVEIEGEPYSVVCHQHDGQLDMEEIHLTRTFAELNNLELHFFINMVGILNEDRLEISGPATGTGTMQILFFSANATMEGQIDGVLEKVGTGSNK